MKDRFTGRGSLPSAEESNTESIMKMAMGFMLGMVIDGGHKPLVVSHRALREVHEYVQKHGWPELDFKEDGSGDGCTLTFKLER